MINAVNERFYHIFSSFTVISTCLFNSMLIYVIIVTHVNHVGPYRWLLLAFAVIDICIALIHALLIPIVHMADFGYICIANRFVAQSTVYGYGFVLLWVFLFYQTYVLLAFHYVYRFVVLCNPPWLSWIQRRPWRNWITIAAIADITFTGTIVVLVDAGWRPSDISRKAYAPAIMEIYGVDLFADNLPGFLALTLFIRSDTGEKVWLTKPLFAMTGLFSMVFASAGIIIYCLVRIVRETSGVRQDLRQRISRTNYFSMNLESKTRQMQRQLFRALLWQTIIPCFTSYSPFALILLIPIVFDVSMGGLGTLFYMSTQLFPMIDPFLILFFVQGYRAALPKFIRTMGLVPFTISTVKSTSEVNSANAGPSVSPVMPIRYVPQQQQQQQQQPV